MLQPKKSKYRKQFRGKRGGLATGNTQIQFGQFGLKATTRGWVTARQIEAARRAMTHYTKRGGRIWIRIFPAKPITKKPPEVKMGSGKGDIHEYVAVVKPGVVMFEMAAVPRETAQEAMRLASHKLGIATRFLVRGE